MGHHISLNLIFVTIFKQEIPAEHDTVMKIHSLLKTPVETIIFDLGGVILNIDYQLTIDAFDLLGIDNFGQLYTQASQQGVFDDFERGDIDKNAFLGYLTEHLPNHITEEQIISAWNAMLLDWDIRKFELLNQLRPSYKTVLLSNTNSIHQEAFLNSLKQETGFSKLDNHFDRVFLSHQIRRRKPDPEAFQYVLDSIGSDAGNTLFIDDSIQHIEGAKKIGIQTYHITQKDEILQLFS